MVIMIGVLHQVVGVAAGVGLIAAPDGRKSGPLIELFRSGFFNQANAEPLRMAMVWFLFFGFMLIFSGVLLRRVPASRGLAVGFAALCGLGVLLMPASGFWLGFIPAVQLWRLSSAPSSPVRAG